MATIKKFNTWAFGQIDYIEKSWPRIMIDLRSCKKNLCIVFLSSFLKNTHRLGCWEQNLGQWRAYPRDVVLWDCQHFPLSTNSLTSCLSHFLCVVVLTQVRWSVVKKYLIQRLTLFQFSVIKEFEGSFIGGPGSSSQRGIFDTHLGGRVQALPGRICQSQDQCMPKQWVQLTIFKSTQGLLGASLPWRWGKLTVGRPMFPSNLITYLSGELRKVEWLQRAEAGRKACLSHNMTGSTLLVWC